ncbi:DUF1329 domain-containing protein [Shewanella loihica]|uniref:DUF1329 domain-containing protein n=1 Tax=Shewanella loihica (strain ATCC BAA-1088 / PV-4) TaxID=323850 RepID=A3QDX4_SHELP|nr:MULTISPECIES: DUF1329 domain-containing protein [Shewanella]ABO23672.1 protein of unknown function DUF1329 [Shewanella loihica PV-4]QYJ84130.1 DUF1329 domain-containing protein [Shewanella aegiceratis]QYJ88303.1 DUF1329 domain-containing protein [Shewanella halotolerans]QYK14644.1 DUF1329 domain-containing protein [Shewanella rhizosphaerae]TVP16167.1 hypothetical protein AYI87_01715 [Shewanella sp. KCT]
MKKLTLLSAAVIVALTAPTAFAKVSEAEAAKLGTELTPLGGEKAGNADGSIPAWDGGITKPVAGYEKGMHHPDPFPGDKIEFTITNANKAQYKDNLTEGQLKLFDLYPDTFKMNVYQTRRTASVPQFVYDATKANASRAELVADGNGISGASIGVPFPIPQNGLEAIWNHVLRFRGVDVETARSQAAPTASGSYTLVETAEEIRFEYSRPEMTLDKLKESNTLFYFKQVVTQPARLAGTALLVKETMDQEALPRQAWTYNTGQRRVRKAPNVAFDTPGTVSDGLRTTDDFDMFNGSPVRYNWELLGKKEIYIPYNDYKLHSDKLKYEQILKPGHINPDYVRWEKHRVWVVKAQLKEGMRHIYKTRVFYLDEDSWQVSMADMYDNRDELYRVAVAHAINYYEVPTHWTTLEVIHDLQSRRYLAMGLDNEGRMYNFDAKLSEANFTPAALRRAGIR